MGEGEMGRGTRAWIKREKGGWMVEAEEEERRGERLAGRRSRARLEVTDRLRKIFSLDHAELARKFVYSTPADFQN